MTNRDRDSVAKLLEQIAQRLADAPAHTKECAEQYQKNTGGVLFNVSAYQAGGLEQVCISSASAIRIYIAQYLSSPPRRGKR